MTTDGTTLLVTGARVLTPGGELRELDESTLRAAMAEAPTGSVRLADGQTIVDLLVSSGLTPSKGAARRAVLPEPAPTRRSRRTSRETAAPSAAPRSGR